MKKLKFKNMTCEEFSNEFDLLYNNIMSNQAPGLDEYEKSVFLTKAQDDIVKRYFTAKGNKDIEGFDSSIKRNIDFSLLYSKYSVTANDVNEAIINKLKQIVSSILSQDLEGSLINNTNDADIFDITNTPQAKNFNDVNYIYPKELNWDFICVAKSGTANNYKSGLYFRINPDWLKKITNNYTEIVTIVQNKVIEINASSIDSSSNLADTRGIDFISLMNTNFTYNSDNRNVIEITYNLDNLFLPINDEILVNDVATNKNKILQVVPISTIEYIRMMSKPFKQPLKNQAWKLQDQQFSNRPTIKLIFGYNNVFQQYILRYLIHPTPIILSSLASADLSINGYKGSSNADELTPAKDSTAVYPLTCKLSAEIHSEILQRAVELAKAAYGGDLSSTVQIGSVSSTNIGQVSSAPQQDNNRYSRQ